MSINYLTTCVYNVCILCTCAILVWGTGWWPRLPWVTDRRGFSGSGRRERHRVPQLWQVLLHGGCIRVRSCGINCTHGQGWPGHNSGKSQHSQEMLNQCWYAVGLTSQTVGQHYSSIDWFECTSVEPMLVLLLGQRRRRWAFILNLLKVIGETFPD